MISSSGHILRSVEALLAGSIDYAGLYPPAKLNMERAVINYQAYRNSEHSWMLGRFVVPVSDLNEFVSIARAIEPIPTKLWRVSVVAGGDSKEVFATIADFNSKFSDAYAVDMVEFKISSEFELAAAAELVPHGLTAYFETDAGEQLGQLAGTIASLKQNAKIRTGGTTNDAFPEAGDIVRFIRVCAAAGIPFKATAGLHHPLRCVKPLTYEPNAPIGTMHGFLNVFLATGFTAAGCDAETAEKILLEESIDAFEFSDAGVSWRGQHILRTALIERVRERYIHSFGSCSFTEPTMELREIGLI